MAKSHSIRGLKKRANRLIDKNKLLEARNIYQPLCKSVPNDLESWFQLAKINYNINQFHDAVFCCNHILSINNEHLHATQMLGMINHQNKNYQAALPLYEKLLQHNHNVSETLYLIGTLYRECGENKTAQKYYEQSLEKSPDDFKTLNNLAEIYISIGKITDAIKLLEKADTIQSDNEYTTNNLGKAYLTLGNSNKASKLFLTLLEKFEVKPDKISNYLLSLNYLNDISPEFIYKQHKHWGTIFHEKYASAVKFKNRKIDTSKPVHIGILSPDLKDHPVVRFIYSFIKYHNTNKLHLYCYSDALKTDKVTTELKKMAHCWHDTTKLTNQQLVDLMVKNSIDILIDLAAHTSGGRVPVLASRVAPLQLTYIGYPNTTGLNNIDYRISDEYADPSGASDNYHTEKLLRLKDCFLSYTPDTNDSYIKKSIKKKDDTIVFGSFNNFAKVTTRVIETWCSILSRVPHSKLIMKSLSSSDEGVQSYYYKIFDNYGINNERIEFVGSIQHKYDHILYYNNVDIALDTFPYNGTTTTMEALWMSTPVIALCGNSHVSRVGHSILTNIGYKDLIANSVEEYINIAVALANDHSRLHKLHGSIRDKMSQSCILNHTAHTNNIEKELLKIIKKHNNLFKTDKNNV